LMTTTVNLNGKLGYLSSRRKSEIFQRHVLLKAFCHFSNVRMRMNAFREEAIADHKVKNTKMNFKATGGVPRQI